VQRFVAINAIDIRIRICAQNTATGREKYMDLFEEKAGLGINWTLTREMLPRILWKTDRLGKELSGEGIAKCGVVLDAWG